MKLDTKYWLKFSLLNLLFVGVLGVIMRYKIGFSFPFLSQKFLQEAHSHFAFSGWIAQTLYVLMINFIQTRIPFGFYKHYKAILIANLICSYGMLISFAISGYGITSIVLSTGTIVIACFFAFYFLKDIKKIEADNKSAVWFKAALWFNIVSSIGTFYLAYMMASRNFNENLYLAAIYFFLHFQYNGFFIFTCMGLVFDKILTVFPTYKHDDSVFKLFFISFIPAYFLSVLWANLPIWLYVIVVIAAIVQIVAWAKFLNTIRKNFASITHLTKLIKNLFLLVALAFTTKLLLQLGSTIPVVSKLAFGFRPVVIAYLHLVLLAVISVFLLLYMYAFQLIKDSKLTIFAIIIFVAGVFLNELVLGIQGVASFSYFAIPMVNEMLFAISLFLSLGLILLVISQGKFSSNHKLNS